MLQQKMMQLNQALRDQNKEKVMQIMDLPEADRILKMEDDSKYTPFFWACSSLSEKMALEVVPRILAKGADPFKIDKYYENVLYYIAKAGKQELLKFLLDRYKYDLNTNDQIKQTPLFFAVYHNHLGCAKLLIQRGADINHIDSNGQNCMFWAASAGHLEMCKFLVNNGINFSRVDANKETALHYAKKNKHEHVISYIQELKNQKKNKQPIKMESSQQEDKVQRKKKQLMQQKYCLVYTNDKGQVHELTFEQLEQFAQINQANRSALDLIYNPNKLDNQPLPQQKRYQKIVNKMLAHFMKHQQGPIFLYPVDYIALNIPHYPNTIKNPMDFTTIKTKLSYNAYDNEVDFNADMNLVFDNCIRFNGSQSSYGKIATQMKLEFNTMYKKQFGI